MMAVRGRAIAELDIIIRYSAERGNLHRGERPPALLSGRGAADPHAREPDAGRGTAPLMTELRRRGRSEGGERSRGGAAAAPSPGGGRRRPGGGLLWRRLLGQVESQRRVDCRAKCAGFYTFLIRFFWMKSMFIILYVMILIRLFA